MQQSFSLPKLGMRNIKTAISVLLSIVVLKFIGMEIPFYGCIAAVITMQNKLDASLKAGLDRMVGTLIGAAFGIFFATIEEHNPLLITLGIALVIYISNLLNQTNAVSIACIVFLSIMTNLTEATPLQYSIDRVLETFVGINIAVAVNYFIYPPKPEEGLDGDC